MKDVLASRQILRPSTLTMPPICPRVTNRCPRVRVAYKKALVCYISTDASPIGYPHRLYFTGCFRPCKLRGLCSGGETAF